MLPLLFVFLLAPAISATNEFPDLMKDVEVVWGGVDLSTRLDARLTSSLDNQVKYLYLCGPFRTEGMNGWCKIKASYELPNSRIDAFSATTAYLFASFDDNNFTCMRFENNIPDFLQTKKNKWSIKYTCDTVNPSYTKEITWAIEAAVAILIVGVISFNFGFRKGARNRPFFPRLGLNFAGNEPRRASSNHPMLNSPIPAYGNPFAQPMA